LKWQKLHAIGFLEHGNCRVKNVYPVTAFFISTDSIMICKWAIRYRQNSIRTGLAECRLSV